MSLPPIVSMVSAVLVGFGFTRNPSPTVAHAVMQLAVLGTFCSVQSRYVHRITRPNALGRQEFLSVSTSNLMQIEDSNAKRNAMFGNLVRVATAAVAILPAWLAPHVLTGADARAQALCASCALFACVRRRWNQLPLLIMCLVLILSAPVRLQVSLSTVPASFVAAACWVCLAYGPPVSCTVCILFLRIVLPNDDRSRIDVDWAAAAALTRPRDVWIVGLSSAISLLTM